MEPWFAWWRLLLFEKQVGWWSWTFSKTLLLMTSFNFTFAKGSCSLFSQVGFVFRFQFKSWPTFEAAKEKKKLSWKKKWNENLTSFLHLSTQMVVLELIWIGLASCVMIDIKHQKKGEFMLKEHFWGSRLLKKNKLFKSPKSILNVW